MIAILERTQRNVQQNIEQLQTPTMGVTKNKKSTTTQPPSQISQIYPSELQLNKTNTSDTDAAFLDLHLSISNIVSTKIYDKPSSPSKVSSYLPSDR